MSIITVSRGSYSHGKEVAEKTAQELNYRCVSREVLLEASKEFNVPEIKLLHAIRDAPSILDRFTYGKEKYIAYIQAAILKHLQKDNVVYHGFAGHFFVRDVPHVLKVRILADVENRIRIVMERNGVEKKEAVRTIKKLDGQRRKWSRHLYEIDTSDPGLYDIVIHLHKITVGDAVDLICHTATLERFNTTAESQRMMNNLALASAAKAALININPDIEVYSQDGVVYVKTHAHVSMEEDLSREMKKAVALIPGIKDIRIQFLPVVPFREKE
ncbi:MAG: cytidylate kinase-like family protein [Desulfobacteraceae bacterium]|jgi:cytidylate kinase